MPEYVKALIIVLVLAVPAFYAAPRISGSYIAPKEIAVWRNAWFATATVGFLSGSYFLFAIILTMICMYARAVGAATLGFYFVLLFAVPLGYATIGGLGFNMLFDINNARLLSIVLLLPILFATGEPGRRNGSFYTAPDLIIVCYVLLQIILDFDHSNVTQIARHATLLALDVLIPYFAFSRATNGTAQFRKVLLAFIIAVLPLALIGIFEAAKGWHLYSSITQQWGGSTGYDRRAGMLRAAATTGSPIVYGFINVVAIGCALAALNVLNQSRRLAGLVLAIFAAAVIASLSRGPWVGVIVLIIAYLASGPSSVANLGKFSVLVATSLVAVLLTPLGDRLIQVLPFTGSIDAGSVTYRENLFESAMVVVERNLWFGSTDFISTPEMMKMTQGEGIIDIVNTYLVIALNSGLVGLGLFLAFFATILIGLWRVSRVAPFQNAELISYARALMAIVIAVLVMIATVSPYDFIPYVSWSFAGLSVALIRIAHRERTAVAYSTRRRQAPAFGSAVDKRV